MRRLGGPLLASLALLAAAGCATPDQRDIARLQEARFVLIGEVHDNAEQHRQRAALLQGLLADGRPTRVVFEQMDRSADAALAAAPREAEAVASAGRLDRRAWGWPLHRPLIDAALDGGATLRGGNLDVAGVRAIVRGGLPAVPEDLREALTSTAWTAKDESRVEKEIDEGHCHALPDSMWAPMALAQRSRDAAMAEAMLRPPEPGHATPQRVVLIAGNGHVRSDLGVPFYLRQAGVEGRDIVSLGYLEKGESGKAAGGAMPFDITRYTAPAQREDPCAAFERR